MRVSIVVAGLAAVVTVMGGLVALPATAARAIDGRTLTEPKAHRCHGHRATIVGTPRDDRLVGTNGRDVIVALAGDDRIVAGGGNDIVCAAGGDDIVYDGVGDDWMAAGAGDDAVHQSPGADRLGGGGGFDELSYQTARKRVVVDLPAGRARIGGESDTLDGFEFYALSRFADEFAGGSGPDSVEAGRGADVLRGGDGADYLRGEDGDDVVNGGPGNDTLYGEAGSDRLTDLSGGNEFFDGITRERDKHGILRAGDGADGFWLRSATYTVTAGGGDDVFNLDGGLSDSTVYAGDGDDTVWFSHGWAGQPMQLLLGEGDDQVICVRAGCAGGNVIQGGAGRNALTLSSSAPPAAVVLGPTGSISIDGRIAREMSLIDFTEVTTGHSDDTITGSDAADTITTYGGDDTIHALGGDDTVDAGIGVDTVDGGDGDDTCVGAETPTSCETLG